MCVNEGIILNLGSFTIGFMGVTNISTPLSFYVNNLVGRDTQTMGVSVKPFREIPT